MCTQFPKLKFIRHNFVKNWQWNLRKCRETDVMVNFLFSLIFSSTARTKSSFTTDSQPLHRISCTFSRPSLNSHTHLHMIELLKVCSPYKIKVSRNRLQTAFHEAGFSILLNNTNTTRCVNTVWMSAICVSALPHYQQTKHTCAPSWPQCCSGTIS